MSTPKPPQLALRGVSLAFAGVQALAATSFEVAQGEICAIIGPNGAGKSSLMNILSGIYQPDQGELWFEGQRLGRLTPNRAARLGIARTTQNLALFRGLSVLDNILLGRTLHTRSGFFSHVLGVGPAARDERVQRAHALEVLRFLEIDAYADRPVSQLAYGLQKRVELGRALAAEPKILLLDEPM
ncbi:MAG: ATP-binding cassette domain-containing protein, partial [Polyangiales bacterium]